MATNEQQKYTFGKGRVYASLIVNGVKSRSRRYLGNSPQFNLSVESEKQDHINSDEGINQIDDSVITQITRTGTLVLDNINDENLALHQLATISDFEQVGDPVIGEALGQAEPAMTYQLGETEDNPIGVRNVSSVTVTVGPAGTSSTATEGVDYTLNAELGNITIIEGGVIDGQTEVEVDYTPAAGTRKRMVTGANASVELALYFESTNPKGPRRDVAMPKVTLSPSGEWALKSDDWQQLTFDVTVNQNAGQAAMYIDGRPAA